MSAECRPPEGTPDGTWCRLRHKTRRGVKWGVLYAQWTNLGTPEQKRGRWDMWPSAPPVSPERMWLEGWRFHSIAEPPHGQ